MTTSPIVRRAEFDGKSFMVGQYVRLLKDLWDDGADHHPPGYLAHKDELLIVRKLRGNRDGDMWPVYISHEGRTDNSLGVLAEDVDPLPNCPHPRCEAVWGVSIAPNFELPGLECCPTCRRPTLLGNGGRATFKVVTPPHMKQDELDFLKLMQFECVQTSLGAWWCSHVLTPRDLWRITGINRKRMDFILQKWADRGWYNYGVNVEMGWMEADGMGILPETVEVINGDQFDWRPKPPILLAAPEGQALPRSEVTKVVRRGFPYYFTLLSTSDIQYLRVTDMSRRVIEGTNGRGDERRSILFSDVNAVEYCRVTRGKIGVRP